MATQLTIVNNVLRRLREDPVSTITENAYAQLIAMFVNDALDDANDVHFWSVYRTAVTVNLLEATETYDLTDTNDKSFVVRHKTKDIPLAYDQTEDPHFPLCLLTEAERYDFRALRDFDVTEAKPTEFSVTLDETGRFYVLNLLATPTAARTWVVWWYIPQYDLAMLTNEDADTEILLNRQFVESRALFYALEERGEVLGPREASAAWMRTVNQLGAAVEIDQQLQKRNEEYDLYNGERLSVS